MILANILNKMLKDEKNPVNRMYLNEIMIKFRKYKKVADTMTDSTGDLTELAKALNDLTNDLNNPKYRYGKTTKGGFNNSSPLFQPLYLDDLVTLFLKQKQLIKKPGIKWGTQKFHKNLVFNPKINFNESKSSMLSYERSPEFLSLVQNIDVQMRISGKRNFEKHQIAYPLLIVQTTRILREKEIIHLNFQAETIKSKFNSTKILIVAEYLEHGTKINLSQTEIDGIILLRKQYASSKKTNDITTESLTLLRTKLYEYITGKEKKLPNIVELGILEK